MKSKWIFILILVVFIAFGDAKKDEERKDKRIGGKKTKEFFKLSSTTAECDAEAGSATIETGRKKDSKIFDGLKAGDSVAICVRKSSQKPWKKVSGTMSLVFKRNKNKE